MSSSLLLLKQIVKNWKIVAKNAVFDIEADWYEHKPTIKIFLAGTLTSVETGRL